MTESGLTPTPSAACTNACTSKPENANADTPNAGQGNEGEGTTDVDQADLLTQLAAELGKLSQEDRKRLADLLIGRQSEGGKRTRG